MEELKAYLLFTACGPVLVLTKYDFAGHPELLSKLAAQTSNKFVAHEVPIDAVKAKYSAHYDHILKEPDQSDIKILDDDGEEIFTNVSFKDLSDPIYYDPK